MPTPPPEPNPPGYDPKKSLVAAAKVGLLAAVGVVLADQMGLTQYLVGHLPAQYAPIGALLITSGLAALKNWYTNRSKTS